MSRIWRLAAPVAVAGGLIAAGIAPAAQASPATYGVTISATSPHYPGASHGKVLGYALVVYKGGKGTNTAVISGTVTGAAPSDTATLLAEPFGAKSFTKAAPPLTLSGAASQSYSFNVKPSLATHYEVQVATGTTVHITSVQQTVYVTESGNVTKPHQKCNRAGTSCTFTSKFFEVLPRSGYNTEAKKHLYVYALVIYRTLPKFLNLVPSATASKARKINAGEFERSITFHLTFRNRNWHLLPLTCSKDSETRDGLGLPGSHGCGAKRLSIKIVYAG